MTKSLLLLLAILASFSTSAQVKSVELGPRTGINMDGEYGALTYGVYVQVNWDKLSLHPEVNYSNLLGDDFNNTDAVYVTLPILMKYKIWKGLSLQAGPQVAFDVDNNSYGIFNQTDRKATEFSVITGIGYDFSFPVNLSYRYLSGIGNNDLGNSSINIESSRYSQISIEIRLYRPKKNAE